MITAYVENFVSALKSSDRQNDVPLLASTMVSNFDNFVRSEIPSHRVVFNDFGDAPVFLISPPLLINQEAKISVVTEDDLETSPDLRLALGYKVAQLMDALIAASHEVYAERQTSVRAMEAEVYDYLVKPYRLPQRAREEEPSLG